jgi:SCP-2 sterol transfer family
METPPLDPEQFFGSYLPTRFGEIQSAYAGVTSIGSLLFRVGDATWSYRLSDGDLELTRAMEDDVVLQVSVSPVDFGPLIVAASEQRVLASRSELPASSFRALRLDAETARLVRRVPGSVLFSARDGEDTRRLLVTPGRRAADFSTADCTIECDLEDWVEAEGGGSQAAMQLFTRGKLRVRGNVQIAMALSSVLG